MVTFENVGHGVPTNVIRSNEPGRVSGFPQKHRVTGAPCLSTSTAVPACRTALTAVACPLTKPWFVTRVSERRMTEVSPLTKVAMSVVRMPRTPAQAAALSGLLPRNTTSLCGSQLANFSVPPKRPTVFAATDPPEPRGPVMPVCPLPTGGENGFAPTEWTGSRRTAVGWPTASVPQPAMPVARVASTAIVAVNRALRPTANGVAPRWWPRTAERPQSARRRKDTPHRKPGRNRPQRNSVGSAKRI